MHQSAFDIETYARTQRENMMRDAEMARKVNAARGGGQAYHASACRPVARLVAAAQGWLAARRVVAVDARSTAPVVSPYRQSLTGQAPVRHGQQGRPTRVGDPYAGMILVARASAVPIAEQPCSMGDR